MTTRWRSLNSNSLYLHIGWADWHQTWYTYCHWPLEHISQNVYQSATRWRSGASLILYSALCSHHNTYGNEIHRGGIDWPLQLTHQKWPAGGAIFYVKAILAHNSHIMCHTLLNLISTYSLQSAKLFVIGHVHFWANFLFAKLGQMQNLLFRTPSRPLDQFALNFAWGIYGAPDKKLSKEFC